jgi:hypothetical protein
LICSSSTSEGTEKPHDEGRVLPKHVGASIYRRIKKWYNQCILLVIITASDNELHEHETKVVNLQKMGKTKKA